MKKKTKFQMKLYWTSKIKVFIIKLQLWSTKKKEKARLIMRRAWQSIEPKLKAGDAKDDIHDLSKFLMDRKL